MTPPESPNPEHLRAEIDRLLDTDQFQRALGSMQLLWSLHGAGATAGFINQRAERLRGRVPLTPCRVAFLRSFTVEPIVPLVSAAALVGGIDVTAHIGEFNAYAQEIIDPGSSLYGFEPAVVFLAVQGSDLVPNLYHRFASLDRDAVEREVARALADFRTWIALLRERTSATIVVHGFEMPETPSAGLLDAQAGPVAPSCAADAPGELPSQMDAIRRINSGLGALARSHAGVHLLDYDGLTARHGKREWFDAAKWLTVRLPISAANLPHMAAEWVRFLHPATGKLIKCLVCDLDNTLWGGVIGEDGITGIRLDGEYPGAGYLELQRAILDMYERGVILAINSKNNLNDAMEALRDHPRMLLRPNHFAALRINWKDKASNMREIAAELNIGIDSLAFIDDNPVERQWVRENVPEVTVVELPRNPLHYARTLRSVPGLERLSLSAEDKSRGRFYAEDRMREELKTSSGSMDDFYKSLDMVADIGSVNAETLARVSQLTQKTNQFNLSTRRYNEAEISALATAPDASVLWMRVSDRFGDNGLIAVAILRFKNSVCDIDTFLMSCRVIGRGVETGFLACIADEATRAGCSRIRADYFVTKKNAPVKDFLPQHRFSLISGDAQKGTWELPLPAPGLSWPAYIRLRSCPPGSTLAPASAPGAVTAGASR